MENLSVIPPKNTELFAENYTYFVGNLAWAHLRYP